MAKRRSKPTEADLAALTAPAPPVEAADCNAVELKVGDSVQIAPECEDEFPTWAGRIGTLESIEPNESRHGYPLVDVQFPKTELLEPAYAELRCNEIVKVQVQHSLRYVRLDSIDIVRNTRSSYDEAALEELTQSVRTNGVMQSVSLRPHPVQPGRYQLAAGHRRYLAAQRAGLVEIPAGVRPMTDHEFLEIQVLENLQREHLNPADEAQAFAELLANQFTVEEIAHRVGKPPQFVAQRASLARLVPEFEYPLRSGRLHVGAALLLARHEPGVQTQLVAELNRCYAEFVTVATVRQWVQRYLRELSRAPFSLEDPTLNPAMGACVTCPLRTSVQQLLFPELAESDCCLNGACYALKVAAHIEQAAAVVAQETSVQPVLIANSHYPANNKLVSRNHFREVDANTPGAVPAVFAEGREGEVVYVQLSKKVSADPEEDPEARKQREKAEREAVMLKNNIQRRHNWLTVEALATELRTTGPWRELLLELAYHELSAYGGPSREQRDWLTQIFGFPAQQANYEGNQGMANYVKGGLAQLSDPEIMALYLVWNGAKSAHFEYQTSAHRLATAGNRIDLAALRKVAERQASAPKRGKRPPTTPEQLDQAIAEGMRKEVATDS